MQTNAVQRAKDQLQRRSERLARLVQLNAPAVIIVREIYMLTETARLLAPDHWYKAVAEHELPTIKNNSGLCAHPNCDQDREMLDLCRAHATEYDDEVTGEFCTIEDSQEEFDFTDTPDELAIGTERRLTLVPDNGPEHLVDEVSEPHEAPAQAPTDALARD